MQSANAPGTPFVVLFKTNNNDGFMFDANRNHIISVGKSVYSTMERLLKSDNFYLDAEKISDEEFSCFYKKTLANGFFKSNRVQRVVHPMDKYLEEILSNNIEGVSLQVTQNCNLRCDYCPYTGNYYKNRAHENKNMDFQTAKKGLDFLAVHSSNSKKVVISFYGGEPLLALALMKQCVEYANSLFRGKEILYTITTNGTLLNKQTVDLLVENNVNTLISLDCPKFIHDKSRVYENGIGSFEVIMKNLEWVRDYAPDYFKSHVSFNSVVEARKEFHCVDDFFNGNEIFENKTILSSVFSDMYLKEDNKKSKQNEEFYSTLQYETFKGYMGKLGRLKGRSVIFENFFARLDADFKLLKLIDRAPKESHPSGPCVPGRLKLFLNANGKFYPCERVDEMSPVSVIGDIDNGLDIEKCRRLLNIGQLTEEECKDCWAFALCKQCFAKSDDNGELSAAKRLSYCDEMKRLILDDFKNMCVLKKRGYTF